VTNLVDKLLSGAHQAFTSARSIEDTSTWRGRVKTIPRDARLVAEFLGALQDQLVINFRHFGRSKDNDRLIDAQTWFNISLSALAGDHLARVTTARAIEESFARTAKDYSDIADDLESGAIEIRHPELMPQLRPRER
jgi:hypothetical protein